MRRLSEYDEIEQAGYTLGLEDGYIDGFTISENPGTGNHTFEEYCRIDTKYKESIYSPTPSKYQLGYGIGLDCAAIYLDIFSTHRQSQEL